MATYKVLQDIEAEDKLVGALTFRQFIYAGIAAFFAYIAAVLAMKVTPLMALPFVPVILISGFFAFPWGRDQPTEVWALAKIRFMIKPRKRIWDQSGVKDLVEVTAPKKEIRNYTNGLSQMEVNSRLNALASTIDSRGWAIKNVDVNLYSHPSLLASEGSSDRLIDMNSFPQEVPAIDINASDDILDEQNNPIAQQFQQMIKASEQSHRKQLVQQMSQQAAQKQKMPGLPADYWFLHKPDATSQQGTPSRPVVKTEIVTPGSDIEPATARPAEATPADEAFLAAHKPRRHFNPYGHLLTIQPPSDDHQATTTDTPQVDTTLTTTPVAAAPTPSPKQPDPAIMELAGNNDLSVATIARQAGKAREAESSDHDEVVISLH